MSTTNKSSYRTRIRYQNCSICGIEKANKDRQYQEICRKCSDDIRCGKARQEKILDLRICSKCNQSKSIEDFVKNGKQRKRACKACDNIRRREHLFKMRREDPIFRMKGNFSQAIRNALKTHKENKPTFSLLPYNRQQLRDHLEAKFDEHMNWDNYGSYWHVDHIYPQSLLPYDTFDHPNFLICWSLDNLQPLEARENIRKSNKIP